MLRIKLLLAIIFCLGFGLRFVNLENVPPGLYVDEAAIGYNAYSILKTGKDEYGKSFPLLFRSFGDYKMPVYIYSSILPIALLGLQPFSVRFISALSGALTVIFIYLIIKEIFDFKKKWLPLIGASIFAISPWGIFFSRGAFESNLALLFLVMGILFLIKGLTKKIFWWFALLLLVLATYTYHSEKLIVPLFFFVFLVLFRERIKQNLVVSILIFLILEIPQIVLWFYPAGQVRFHQLNVLSGSPQKMLNEIFAQYTAYFSPRNLFFDPDPDPQRSLPGLSVFYSWMVIPYLVGFWCLFKQFKNFGAKLTISFLAIFPLPAAITGDPFSSLRAQPLLLPLTMVIALGIGHLISLVKNKILIISLFLLFTVISLFSLYRSNFVLMPNERFLQWNYGYNLLVQNLKNYKGEKILIDDPQGISYIELLFFLKYNPQKYQKTNSFKTLADYYQDINWNRASSFDNIQVGTINWQEDVYEDQIIVARPLAVSDGQASEHALEKIFTIKHPTGEVIFNGFKTNPMLKIKNSK